VSPGHTARPPAALIPVSQDDVPIRSGPKLLAGTVLQCWTLMRVAPGRAVDRGG